MKHLLYLPILFSSLAFSEETITFTNCGQEGRFSPSQEQCDSEYGEGLVNVVDGIQEWTVPYIGTYTIEVMGARGGNGISNGGNGAQMKGEIVLSQGEILRILVGQSGGGVGVGGVGGGGGGTFIWNNTDELLIAGEFVNTQKLILMK